MSTQAPIPDERDERVRKAVKGLLGLSLMMHGVRELAEKDSQQTDREPADRAAAAREARLCAMLLRHIKVLSDDLLGSGGSGDSA